MLSEGQQCHWLLSTKTTMPGWLSGGGMHHSAYCCNRILFKAQQKRCMRHTKAFMHYHKLNKSHAAGTHKHLNSSECATMHWSLLLHEPGQAAACSTTLLHAGRKNANTASACLLLPVLRSHICISCPAPASLPAPTLLQRCPPAAHHPGP